MKLTRLLWILMVAMLVPALALSSCDGKKKRANHDDDDESSSSSSDSTEMVKKEKKTDDISGSYEMDRESVMDLFVSEVPDSDVVSVDAKYRLDLNEDNTLKISYIYYCSIYLPEYDTNMNNEYETIGRGTWSYDKKQRLLYLDIRESELADADFSFDDENEQVKAEIEAAGGYEAFKNEIISGLDTDNVFEDAEFKITELTDDGFYARLSTRKDIKVKFNRID